MKKPYIEQGNSTAVRQFLVEDMITGYLDGLYPDDVEARLALDYHRRTFPKGRWMLLEVIVAPAAEGEGRWTIPEHRWHAHEDWLSKK